MLKCSECGRDIDIENKIYRCFDGTVCSKNCQIDRCLKIEKKDKKLINHTSWGNTTSYLIDPNKTTTKEIYKTPSFVPIYVKSRSDLKKTISKYDLNNTEKKNSYDYSNNIVEQNILLNNLGNLSIFDNSYVDCSYNLLYNGANKLYNGANKLYNIINKII